MTVACYRIRGKVTAKTPLHIGSGRRVGIIKNTFPFIPGSFTRGSTGVCLLRTTCKKEEPLVDHSECEFLDECAYAILLGEEAGKQSNIFFRYAYPLHMRCEGGIFQPTPLTTFVCKNKQCGEVYNAFKPPAECKRCEKPLKQALGYTCSSCGEWKPHPAETTRTTSTALDRISYSAAQIETMDEKAGTLHTVEAIDKGAVFNLELILNSDCNDYLNQVESILMRGVPDEGIGGSKSRGLGKVEIAIQQSEAVSTDRLEERASAIDTRDFSVQLLSPMILGRGQILEASTLLEGARNAYSWAFHEGKPRLPEVELRDRMLSFGSFSGWSLKEERRRRIETAISPGSVFSYKCRENDATLAKALAALEYHAIGSYKPHGCGQLLIVKAP